MAKLTYQVIQKPIEERLIDAACVYWEVERPYFSQKTQDTTVVYRKSVLYYLIKTACPHFTFENLAGKFGFLSHQPVMRAVEKIEAQKNIYKQTFNDINQISHLADKLDATFITTSIELITNKQ